MPLFEQHNSGSSGNLDFPKINKPVKLATSCIEQSLEQFAIEFKGTSILNEPGLTQEFCDILNDNSGDFSFWFHHQNYQDTSTGISASTDIGVKTREEIIIHTRTFSRRKTFFELEAKRLPARSKPYEKEYVIGKNNKMGGIERFKIGKHGKNVMHGGIIGFVQKHDFDHWYKTINRWIEKLVKTKTHWSEDDKLILKNPGENVQKYHSNCKREIGITDSIDITHWWVKMN